MAAEGDEAPLSQSRFSVRSAAAAAGTHQDGSLTPVSRRPSRSILSEALAPSPRKQPTPSRGSLIPRKGSIASSQREQNAERVKVVVRVRPPRASETGGAIKVAPDHRGIVLNRESSTVPSSTFDFDKVLTEAANQVDVYHAAVQPIVEDVLNGYNGTIMAYGQTGAGKTYTLSSRDPNAIGMMPRAAAAIFSAIEHDQGHSYTVMMSYIQLYMELLQDLIQPQNSDLQIRENEKGVYVAGVSEREVSSMDDCLNLLHIGDRNRVVAFTALNAQSSRSHGIVMLTIVKRPSTTPKNRAVGQKVKVGRLFMVDLAGSERLKKSRSTGLRATEAVSINLSLTTLGMCINARADPNATHVPFRDSKLTRLLQESLGGNAKTSLVIAVANAVQHSEETLQSLQFGSRAMRVQTQAVVNECLDFKVLDAELMAAMDLKEDRSQLLEATLQEKESQLEQLTELQKEEQERNRRILAALEGEKQDLASRHERLSVMLDQTKAEAEDLASKHARELQHLKDSLEEALQALTCAQDEQATAEVHYSGQARMLEQQHEHLTQKLQAQHTHDIQEVHALYRAMLDDTTQQQASTVKHERDQHAAEREQMQRLFEQERERMSAEFSAAMQASTAKHEAQVRSLRQERRKAEEDAARHHAAAMQSMQQAHKLEQALAALQGRLAQELGLELEAAEHRAELQVAELQQRLRLSEEAGAAARSDIGRLKQEQNEDARMMEERWRLRLEDAEAAAQAKLDRARDLISQYEDTITELSQDSSSLTASAQALRDDNSALSAGLESARAEAEHLQECLQTMKGELVKEQQHSASLERSRAAFLSIWRKNRMRSRAARLIQRHFRAQRLRQLLARTQLNAKALEAVEGEKWTLEGQKTEMLRQQQRHLAWSGQALIANSVSVMEEAVDQIRATFLFTSKELKALNGMQKKFGGNGLPIAPVRSRSLSRTASPKWAIRAASFTGSPFAGSKPLPGPGSGFISPSTSPSGTPRVSSFLSTDTASKAGDQVPALQQSESPERHTQHEREQAVIERISAQDIAPKAEAAEAWGPLGSSQSIPKFPPLAPSNSAALVRPSAKNLSPGSASFRSPMQFGLSRLPQDPQLQNVAPQGHRQAAAEGHAAQLPKVRIPARPGQGAARKATDDWGARRATGQ